MKQYKLGNRLDHYSVWDGMNRANITVQGARLVEFDIPGMSIFQFVVHRDPNNDKLWSVSERSSGCLCGSHRKQSRELAILETLERLKWFNPSTFGEVIRKARAKTSGRELFRQRAPA